MTNREIIARALKKLGVLRAGGTPQADEMDGALISLQSMFHEWITNGAFGRVYNMGRTTSGDFTPYPNQHVNVLTDEATNIILPNVLPWDWWGCCWRPCRDYGWGLPWPDTGEVMPRDKSVIEITYQQSNADAEERRTYIYDGTIQRWVRVDALALDEEAPLSQRNPDGLSSVLATRLAEFYGETPQPGTISSASRYRTALVTNFGNADNSCGDYYYGCA